MGRSHPSVWVLIEKLKLAAADSDRRLLRTELNLEGTKQKKYKYIIGRSITQNFLENNDLDNCLKKLAIIVKLD